MEVLPQNVEKYFGLKRLTRKDGHCVYITFKNESRVTKFLDLLIADEFDVNELPTKKNCTLFRYFTPTTLAGGMAPALMINIERNLIYFFDEEKNDWDSRGCKAELWSEHWELDFLNKRSHVV
jgi:hypothetical protein